MNTLLPQVGLILHGKTRCPRDWFVDEVSASFHRIYYVISGKVQYDSALEHFALKSSRCYIFPVFTPYRIRHDPKDPLICVYLHINVPHMVRNKTLNFDLSKDSALFHLVKSIEKLIESDAPVDMIASIVTTLLRRLALDENLSLDSDRRLIRIIEYIQNNINKKVDNMSLARLAGLNPRYFIRFFRKHLGQTPQNYVSAVRFNRAAELLNAGSKVRDTAEAVGFSDSASFYRFFRQRAGRAPSRYQGSSQILP